MIFNLSGFVRPGMEMGRVNLNMSSKIKYNDLGNLKSNNIAKKYIFSIRRSGAYDTDSPNQTDQKLCSIDIIRTNLEGELEENQGKYPTRVSVSFSRN